MTYDDYRKDMQKALAIFEKEIIAERPEYSDLTDQQWIRYYILTSIANPLNVLSGRRRHAGDHFTENLLIRAQECLVYLVEKLDEKEWQEEQKDDT